MDKLNIATALKNKRKEKGITQEDLANYIGVTKASVSKWETEQSYPDITFLPVIATYFDITIDDLLGQTIKSKHYFDGAFVRETIKDESYENLLNYIQIEKLNIPNYDYQGIKDPTFIYFKTEIVDFPKHLSHAMIDGYFIDIREVSISNNIFHVIKYYVFNDKVCNFAVGDKEGAKIAYDELYARGFLSDAEKVEFGYAKIQE